MNILLTSATGYPSPDTGGPNKIIFYLLKSVFNYNHKIGYISKHFQLNASEIFPLNPINQFRSKLYYGSRFYRNLVTHPLYLQFHYNRLHNFFNSKVDMLGDYDCVNAHDVLSGYYLRQYSKKKILTLHSKGSFIYELNDILDSKSRAGKLVIDKIKEMERIAFNEATYVTFPSFAAKDMFLKAIGENDTDKIKIIHNGVDLIRIDQIEKSERILNKYKIPTRYSYFILNVADHIRTKNIDKLILAIELLVKKHHENVCFINVGTGPLALDLKRMTNHLGLNKNIFFVGTIPNDDVIKLMKFCDYFLMSSDNVVFDMVILEALACATVVIASHRGGNTEILTDGVNGYFLYANEPEEIVQKIRFSNRKVTRGAAETIKSFTLNSMAEKYFKLYSL